MPPPLQSHRPHRPTGGRQKGGISPNRRRHRPDSAGTRSGTNRWKGQPRRCSSDDNLRFQRSQSRTRPESFFVCRAQLPRPVAGTRLIREWQGVEHCATVLDDGFEYQGRRYKSLSAIARAITGTRWNGPLFWGLRNHRGGK